MLDPLDVSSLLPVPALHVQRSEPLYSVDAWLFNISLHGLSNVYLDRVSVTRNSNLSTVNILTQTRLDMAAFQAVWSISMSRTVPRSCYGVSYAIKNQLVTSKAPY